MGETDYKDEEWTEKDWEEFEAAGREGQRRRELSQTPEGREQLKRELEEEQRKDREQRAWRKPPGRA